MTAEDNTPYLDLSTSEHAALARLTLLDKIAERLRIRFDAQQSEQVMRKAVSFFEEAHPKCKIQDCGKRDDYKILLRREFVFAMALELAEEIKGARKRLPLLDARIEKAVAEMIKPWTFSAELASERLRVIDPLMWGCKDFGSWKDEQNPTERELALIQLEHTKNKMVGSEKSLGGEAGIRAVVKMACFLNAQER